MTDFRITSVSMSMELKRSTYGNQTAENRFVSFRADVPEGVPGSTPEDALAQSMDMHLLAWESIYGAELAAGNIKNDEFTSRLDRIRLRTAKIKAFLKEPIHD